MLYRFYDADDVLLYVGITMNPSQRWATHREEKAWWFDVATVRTQIFDTREDVLEAERNAIQVERPLHNVVHNKRSQRAQPKAATVKAITLACETCGGPAAYVQLPSHAEVHDIEIAHEEHQEKKAAQIRQMGFSLDLLGDLLRLPTAKWTATCETCDTVGDETAYYIEARDLVTAEKILDWTLHLMEKRWLEVTNWQQFAYRLLGRLR